jgi:hypothetical protein
LTGPFSLVLHPDGSMLLSEFQANRIVRLAGNGAIQGYIGDAAGPGRLVGPQYMAVDEDGFIYVSDMGFSRVVKFAADGRFMLAFGARSPEFGGLKMPTGLALLNGLVYVADAALKGVYVFDRYGNYQTSLAEGRLQRPEGLRVYGARYKIPCSWPIPPVSFPWTCSMARSRSCTGPRAARAS